MAQIEYVRELKDHLTERFAKQKAQIEHTRALRALLHEVKIPDAYKTTTEVVKTPLLADMVQRTTATLTVNEATYHATPLGSSDQAQDISSLKEKWLPAAYRRMEQEERRRTFRMLMSAAIGDGMAVSQLLWKPQAWSPWPRRKADEEGEQYTKRTAEHTIKRPFPFALRDLDPLSYYYFDRDSGGREVLIVKRLPLGPTAKALRVYRQDGRWIEGQPGKEIPPTESTSKDVEVWEHWDEGEVTYALDGEQAKVMKNPWPEPPFVDFAGLSSHERVPERSFLPVTFAFEHLIPFLDRLLTMKSNWMYMAAFPQPVLHLTLSHMQQLVSTLPPEQARANTPMVELGKLLTLYEGEDFSYASLPPVGDDLNQLLQWTMQMIDAAGMSPIMRGISPGADATGYLANQMMTAARLAYDPITDNSQFAKAKEAWLVLWGTDHLCKGQPVPVWGEHPKKGRNDWLMLGSKEIDGHYDIECKIEPLLPSNFIMEGQFGISQVQGGAISMKTHREKYLHISAPEDEEKQILLEKVKASPVYEDLMMKRIALKAGLMWPPPTPPAPPPMPGAMPGAPVPEAMPVTPGQGMPLSQESVQPSGMPAVPNNGLPGAGPQGQPGGNYGRQVVPNG
jgi:hypothetical protein